jgi:hypothetical protein
MAENAQLRLWYSYVVIELAVPFAKKAGLSPFNMINVLGIFSFVTLAFLQNTAGQ